MRRRNFEIVWLARRSIGYFTEDRWAAGAGCGGQVHNPLILAQLSAALPGIEVLPSVRLGIPEDAKEAFAFALLAYETFHQRPANLPSATGARGPAILGKISYAPPL